MSSHSPAVEYRIGRTGKTRGAVAVLRDLVARNGIVAAWAVVIVVFSIARPETFPTASNAQTILGSQAVLVVLTLALIVTLAAGEFDLSVAGTLGISLVLVGTLNVTYEVPIVLAVAVALGVGLLVGAINAFFTIVVGVESFVVTLGMGTLLAGCSQAISAVTVGGISDGLVDVMRGELFGIQYAFYYGLLLTAIVWYVLSRTPIGRYIYFVGLNGEAARLAGIRVNTVRWSAFLFSGFCAALAGVVLAGTLGASDPNVGPSFLLPAFAAAFLGSTAITPGRFNAWGSWVAVYFLVTGITGLQLIGVEGWVEQVFYGAALVLAVAFSRLAGRKR